MSLHKLFLFFFQHFYCFLQFLQVIFVFIRLPFPSSCLQHQQWGSFWIFVSFINKIFKFLINMLIYFWKILSRSFHGCNFFIYGFQIMISGLTFFFFTFFFFFASYFTLEYLADNKHLFDMYVVSGLALQEIMWSVIIQCAFNDTEPIFYSRDWSLKLNPFLTASWPWLNTKTAFKTKNSSGYYLKVELK